MISFKKHTVLLVHCEKCESSIGASLISMYATENRIILFQRDMMPKDDDLLQKIQDLQTEVDNLKLKLVHQVIFWHTDSYSLLKFKCMYV